MRIVVLNAAYGTGDSQNLFTQVIHSHHYLLTPQKYLYEIALFLQKNNPDLIALVEVDAGSIRTGFINQIEFLANKLGYFYYSNVKYGKNSIPCAIPILRKQSNAILSIAPLNNIQCHYFPVGVKKLIIEADLGPIRLFLLHLSLRRLSRKLQLKYLNTIIKQDKPIIVCGDFNTFSGHRELLRFAQKNNLYNPNTSHLPTHPAWSPQHELDYILLSKSIKNVQFTIPPDQLSDHLPLLIDIPF